MKHSKFKLSILLVFVFLIANAQQKNITIQGAIKDKADHGIPYASLTISSTYIGTSSNDDGNFNLKISNNNLLDTLEVASIGYITSKIIVKDFIALKKKVIILKENVVSLDEIKILSSIEYVKLAYKNLKKNTVSTAHQLTILNRLFFLEQDKAKYYVEHYLKIRDEGPKRGNIKKMELLEGRKSADYRIFKDKMHAQLYTLSFMNAVDPLRREIYLGDYKWKKIGDTSYDGEDIVIIQGKSGGKNNYLNPIFYIGLDTYKVYKTTNVPGNVVYVYSKNREGKMYLSYHNHYNGQYKKLNSQQKALLKVTDPRGIKISKKNEVIVVNVEFDRKKVDVVNNLSSKDLMEDVEFKYNSDFWSNFVLPLPTEYYKKSIIDLETNYGVPIEAQFKMANR